MIPTYASLLVAALAALADAHGEITNAQGESGSPASVGFKVNAAIPRNCTNINPCQDSTLIRDAEIAANIVNTCGRTELSGNIDVGEETENAIAANAVTSVKPGTTISMTIHQVNADGAGPYTCDLDETSNSGVFQNLSVTDNVPGVNGLSQAKTQDFVVKVTMPDTLNCIGGSTGNICTVRCRNNAQAGPFGGCFAVQQTDKAANVNTPSNIAALKSLDTVNSQVAQNNKDFPNAVQANVNKGSTDAVAQQAAVNAILQETIVSKSFAAETPTVVLGNAAASTTAASAAATTTAASKKSKGNKANANANANANAATGASSGRNKNNNKRSIGSSMRWAKRYISSSDETEA